MAAPGGPKTNAPRRKGRAKRVTWPTGRRRSDGLLTAGGLRGARPRQGAVLGAARRPEPGRIESLARLRQSQDRVTEARQILALVYDRFTEGFKTADLRAARAMLDRLPVRQFGAIAGRGVVLPRGGGVTLEEPR